MLNTLAYFAGQVPVRFLVRKGLIVKEEEPFLTDDGHRRRLVDTDVHRDDWKSHLKRRSSLGLKSLGMFTIMI
jgi:hypothetical protein